MKKKINIKIKKRKILKEVLRPEFQDEQKRETIAKSEPHSFYTDFLDDIENIHSKTPPQPESDLDAQKTKKANQVSKKVTTAGSKIKKTCRCVDKSESSLSVRKIQSILNSFYSKK